MASKYCVNCDRVVEAKRIVGAGSLIMVLCTLGWWILAIPFYSKRCPICKGTSFGEKTIQQVEAEATLPQAVTASTEPDPLEKLQKLQELKNAGTITTDEFNEYKNRILASVKVNTL